MRRNKANLASVLLSFGVLSCSGQLAIGTIDLDGGTSRNDVAFGTTVGSDAGADEGGAGATECDDYFAASYTRCGGPALPASEVARIRTRFEQVCRSQIALPGSGMTAAGLEACASALNASACEFPDGPPAECVFAGTLAGGAPCNEGFQCASGVCSNTELITPGGTSGPTHCGTCLPAAAIGQVCAQGNSSAGCPSGAICLIDPGQETASQPTYSCVALGQGDLGASCDDLSATCKTGLYCSAGQCAQLRSAGESCGEGATLPGNPGGCAAPLSCVGTGSATCSIGTTGSSCQSDVDCSPGLGCISGACLPVTWIASGQSCDGFSMRCLVGSCSLGIGPTSRTSPDGGRATSLCSTVTADGQPCSGTCDTFAQCFDPVAPDAAAGLSDTSGTCTLLDSVACK